MEEIKSFENGTINLEDIIREPEVEKIVTDCRNKGIKQITISGTFTGLINILTRFEEFGCKVNGLTKVESSYKDMMGEIILKPAIIVEL